MSARVKVQPVARTTSHVEQVRLPTNYLFLHDLPKRMIVFGAYLQTSLIVPASNKISDAYFEPVLIGPSPDPRMAPSTPSKGTSAISKWLVKFG